MTTDNSTLNQFANQNHAPTVRDLPSEASDTVLDAFKSIRRYETEVTINGKETFLVGRSPTQDDRSFRLYRHPSDGEGAFAGEVRHDREYGSDNVDRVGFKVAGEGPDEEQLFEPVESLIVREHSRLDDLNDALPEIRTALTNSDWTSGRADTGYGEWIQAVNTLATFVDEADLPELRISPKAIMQARVMHGIARYPLSADNLLAQVASSFEANCERGVHDATPEAFSEVLMAFHEKLSEQDVQTPH